MSHLMSLSGVKRTWCFALHMSAYDPKRTCRRTIPCTGSNHARAVLAAVARLNGGSILNSQCLASTPTFLRRSVHLWRRRMHDRQLFTHMCRKQFAKVLSVAWKAAPLVPHDKSRLSKLFSFMHYADNAQYITLSLHSRRNDCDPKPSLGECEQSMRCAALD